MNWRLIYIAMIILLLIVLILACYVLFGRLTARDRQVIFEKYQTLNHDGIDRQYRFFSPQPNKKLPLVVMIHGYRFDSGKRIELYSGMSNLAAKNREFAVVYPEGVDKSWNGEICCGTAQGKNIDDVGFVEKLITELSKNENIDDSKIYVVGFSNGGFLAQRLLNNQPKKFAAEAIIMSSIGGLNGEKLDISNASSPVLIVNGKHDSYTNHSLPRDGFKFRTHDETVKAWTNQLNAKTNNESPQATTYKDQDGYVVVTSQLYDTKHIWPGWRPWSFDKEIPDFTNDVWEFFKSQ